MLKAIKKTINNKTDIGLVYLLETKFLFFIEENNKSVPPKSSIPRQNQAKRKPNMELKRRNVNIICIISKTISNQNLMVINGFNV